MARARNIKPGFFINEDLVELGFATRLLFAGLWTLADREGRLEDRPKKIKIGVFPADDVNVDVMLQELHDAKFIQRYEINGVRYVQITNWSKHQNPHHTEKQSEIPDINGELTVKTPKRSANNDAEQADINGELTVKDLGQYGGNLADSLIPDSLIHKEANASLSTADAADAAEADSSSIPACPHAEIIRIFGEQLPELPQPRAELWDGQRAKALTARWRWCLTAKRADGRRYATNREEALQWFGKFFAYVRRCPHLMGENTRSWTADLGWLVKADNFAKVQQGNYDSKEIA